MNPTYLTNIAFNQAPVIGRAKQLKTIRERLAEASSVVLVNGLGGIGKTTIALEFIRQYQQDYAHIAWVEVTDRIATAFVTNTTLVKNLNLSAELADLANQSPDTYEAQAFKLIINTINKLDRCLLVIDNANDLDDLRAHQHRLRSLRATTLLTSRALPEEWTVVKIEELSPRDAYLLFSSHFHIPIEAEQTAVAKALLQCLDYHTLLIELVAKAANKARLSLTALHDKVQGNYLHDKDLNTRTVHIGAHADHTRLPQQERVENYITMVFKEMPRLSDTEQRYLRYLCLLPSNEYEEDFLIDIFTYQPKEKENEENPKILTTELKTETLDTLEALAQQGWLTQKRDERGYTYKLHSLVQDVAIRELKLPYEEIEFFVKYITAEVTIHTTTKNFIEKFIWIPFAEHVLEVIIDREHASYADLQHWLAWLIRQTGDYKKAKTLLESAKDISEKVLDASHPDIGRNYSTLGLLCNDLGEYKLAAAYLEKAVENAINVYNENHPEVAVRQSNLATVYRDLGEYERAQDLLEKALTSDIQNFGESHPTVAVRQSNLANVYGELGEYERARDLLEKALASDRQHFGESHPTVAVYQSNLALVYEALGQYEEARDLLEKVLASDIQHFGESHPTVAVDQSNLATVYRNLGEYERARDLLEKALASGIQNFGESHPNVAVRYNNLIEVYVHFQQWEKAQDACDKSLAIRMSVLGSDHPHTKISQKWQQWLQAQLGKPSEPSLPAGRRD